MAIKITGTTVISDNRDLENISNISDFVQGVSFVEPPQLYIDGVAADDVSAEPTLVTDKLSIFGGGSDTHASTDWEVVRTSDSSTVFSSIGDTTNLTSITVSPALDNGEEYLFRVRHNGASLGASEYREVVGTVPDPLAIASLGESVCGGFYMGTICAASTCYYLIVAPNSSGCACCQWKTSRSATSGTSDLCDGYANTYPAMENTSHPAGNFTATRTIGGFSDWYLPAVEELQVFYDNGASTTAPGDPLPSGEDFAGASYWSSTEVNNVCANTFNFPYGGRANGIKDFSVGVRAVRREPV